MLFIYWPLLYRNKGTVNLSDVKSNIDLFCKDMELKPKSQRQLSHTHIDQYCYTFRNRAVYKLEKSIGHSHNYPFTHLMRL